MTSPLLCAPADKAQIEARNSVAQLDLLEYWLAPQRTGEKKLRKSHLLELQSKAVEDIYPCAGKLRDALHRLEISDGAHSPPDAHRIDGLLGDMLDFANDTSKRVMARAAFTMWRINWIHPFNGGNGRTARSAAYFILAADLGFLPPGNPSLPGLIKDDRDGYIDALRATDSEFSNAPDAIDPSGVPIHVLPMEEYLAKLFYRQLRAAVSAAKS